MKPTTKAAKTPAAPATIAQTGGDVQERIRRRAYELYEQRGHEDGHEVEDWLRAEQEVTGTGSAMTEAKRPLTAT